MKNFQVVLLRKKKFKNLNYPQNNPQKDSCQEDYIQENLQLFFILFQFIDDDGICHMQYEYKFKICKDWNEQ